VSYFWRLAGLSVLAASASCSASATSEISSSALKVTSVGYVAVVDTRTTSTDSESGSESVLRVRHIEDKESEGRAFALGKNLGLVVVTDASPDRIVLQHGRFVQTLRIDPGTLDISSLGCAPDGCIQLALDEQIRQFAGGQWVVDTVVRVSTVIAAVIGLVLAFVTGALVGRRRSR
jgi:hypothetical protein